MTNLVKLQNENDRRWEAARITRSGFESIAKKVIVNKPRYQDIVKRCRDLGSTMDDSSWVFVAVAHDRESDMDFTTNLGQGDPLNRKTVHVPAGRGPFFGPDAFERAAVDALVECAPHAAIANRDWSISGILTYLERYNGLGYASRGIPSPYVWAGTNQYLKGKYIRDKVFDANAVDKQLGCAGLILAIDALDDGLNFSKIPVIAVQPVLPEVDKVPVGGVYDAVWLQWVLNQLGAIPQLRVDGINGPATRDAVRNFQTGNKLTADGIAGKETISAIKVDLRQLGKPLFP